MTVKSKFYQLGSVETNNSTTQFLEITGINTDYAVLHFLFNGMIDHTGGGGTNIPSGQWQAGLSIQMQGAWAGGPNASAAKYRNLQMIQVANSGNWQGTTGVYNSSNATTDYGEQCRQYYDSSNADDTERFTLEGWVVQPGNNQVKEIMWKGSGTTLNGSSATAYACSGWSGVTKLDAQHSSSAPRAMAPMDSIRIGAGWDSAGNPKFLGVYSSLTVFGEGWTSDVQKNNDWT